MHLVPTHDTDLVIELLPDERAIRDPRLVELLAYHRSTTALADVYERPRDTWSEPEPELMPASIGSGNGGRRIGTANDVLEHPNDRDGRMTSIEYELAEFEFEDGRAIWRNVCRRNGFDPVREDFRLNIREALGEGMEGLTDGE